MLFNRFVIRLFDLTGSLVGFFLLLPLFVSTIIAIWLNDFGNPFFLQKRVGINGSEFRIIKFRTMIVNNSGPLISSSNDSRITKIGKFLRKYKLDELPQLINVIMGQMSIIGPRPEVESYVKLYSKKQRKVLTVKPGITDYASIIYRNENEILSKVDDKKLYYINIIMPRKLRLNMVWVNNYNIPTYFDCIFRTIIHIVRH